MVILGFGGIVFYVNTTSQQKAEEQKVISAKSAFSIETQPENSVAGIIDMLTGDVTWESRVATEPAILVKTTKIQQGEEIQTGTTGILSILFPAIGKLTISPSTDVQIVQTIPELFVVGQTKGRVTYETVADKTFSIRSFHLLAKVAEGKADITVDDEYNEITIFPHSGTVTVGFNDLDNISTVKTISPGETFIYNDDTRDSTIK